MSHWVWLSRVTLFGLAGTAALAAIFFSTLGLNSSPGKHNSDNPNGIPSDRLLATTIAPEEIQALKMSSSPPQTLTTSEPQTLTTAPPQALKTTPSLTPKTAPSQTLKTTPPSTPKTASPQTSKNTSSSTPKTGVNRSIKLKGTQVQKIPFDLKKSLMAYAPLFTTPTSLGMVAIGVAEGNYQLIVKGGTLYVQQTPNYFGHTDPGNLSWGEMVRNYGPCSDQGRSRGNIALAEQMCLQRSREELPIHLADLNAAGINPNQDIEAVLNTADLYNQASPIHSRYFPKALAIARRGGLKGIEALTWARTASFYLNLNNELDLEKGSNQATGLLGICIRENRPITEWECVYGDQLRRVKAIAFVLEKYRQRVQQVTD